MAAGINHEMNDVSEVQFKWLLNILCVRCLQGSPFENGSKQILWNIFKTTQCCPLWLLLWDYNWVIIVIIHVLVDSKFPVPLNNETCRTRWSLESIKLIKRITYIGNTTSSPGLHEDHYFLAIQRVPSISYKQIKINMYKKSFSHSRERETDPANVHFIFSPCLYPVVSAAIMLRIICPTPPTIIHCEFRWKYITKTYSQSHLLINMNIPRIDENKERHTSHTTALWYNPKQWQMAHTSYLMMMMIR